jgi:NNP family nitrate/nitrite transporter-like MFS transporter
VRTEVTADGKAVRLNLFGFGKPHMRAFHMAWLAFFVSFFAWFGIAPLMAVIRDDLGLTKGQVANTVIASVAGTIVARLVAGWLVDRIGPRKTYSGLLVVGAFPVVLVGLADSYETFLLFRLAIGVIGASFVITQYHTSVMFAPNVVGSANATAAGWGNLGGGVTQVAMPLALAAVVAAAGVSEAVGWRVAMVLPGLALLAVGSAYYFLTQDTPEGNFNDPRTRGKASAASRGSFAAALRDHRVWALFFIYGACFGLEVTVDNIAALYFHDRFSLSLGAAGLAAGLFGFMNLFARALGGYISDRAGIRFGLRGRVWFLGGALFLEGVFLLVFSQMDVLVFAVCSMMLFGLFVKMSNGATYSVVPFVNRKALGAVAGIVGAGGNAGAVAAGFLFKVEGLDTQGVLALLGIAVIIISGLVFLVRFSAREEVSQRTAVRAALLAKDAASAD